MTKEELQKELKEKIKPGVKASDLKKLKRSKSADGIPSAPPSPAVKIKELEDKVSVLELRIETKDRELQEKQGEIESLVKNLAETKQELDTSLQARHEAVKQFGKIQEKLKEVRKELTENVEQASTELTNQDEKVSQYRTNHQKAQAKIQELERDLQLSQRLAEFRKYPLPESNFDYSTLLVWVFLALWFITLLNNSWKPSFKDH